MSTVIPLRTKMHSDFRMSVALPEGGPEQDVYAALRLAERMLDEAYRSMNERVDANLPAVTPGILRTIRDVADNLNIAADNGEFAMGVAS